MVHGAWHPPVRSHHEVPVGEVAEEVGLQLIAQVVGKAAAAVDAEGDGQVAAQGGHELVPLALRHDALLLVVLLKVGIALEGEVLPRPAAGGDLRARALLGPAAGTLLAALTPTCPIPVFALRSLLRGDYDASVSTRDDRRPDVQTNLTLALPIAVVRAICMYVKQNTRHMGGHTIARFSHFLRVFQITLFSERAATRQCAIK